MLAFFESELQKFVGVVAARQYRPQRKHVGELLFGIIAARSVMLSEIGRALNEDSSINVTENRLSSALKNPRLDRYALEQDYLSAIEPFLRDDSEGPLTIAIDGSEVVKPYARRLENLCFVRDGSDPEGKTKPGYWTIAVEASTDTRRLPLCARLYSSKDPEFRGEHEHLARLIRLVKPVVPDEAVFAFDRGYDSRTKFRLFHELGIRFVVRLGISAHRGRKVWVDGGFRKLHQLADELTSPWAFKPARINAKAKRMSALRVGWLPSVRLQAYAKSGRAIPKAADQTYSLVIVRGTGQEAMVLLTTEQVTNRFQAKAIANHFFNRWPVEETFRFQKSRLLLEKDMRVHRYASLQALLLMTMLTNGFLSILIAKKAPRLFEALRGFKDFQKKKLPRDLRYRLVSGLSRMLQGSQWIGAG